jgi:hypothetical protein
MRTLVIGLAVILGGCASAPQLLGGAVGPAPAAAPEHAGRLLVYSALRVTTVEQSEYPVHSAYVLSDADGRPIREVRNASGSFASEPESVALAAGRYEVKALEVGGGYVIVPLVIAAGRTTVIDLDGTALPQRVAGDAWVRLPDGHVVGWRAE